MPLFARTSAAIAVIMMGLAGPALAQDDRSPNFLDNLFGNNTARSPAPSRNAGPDEAELTVQIDRLQAQIRQLTGTVEQLQYRNQQLEQQVRSMGGNVPGPGGMSAAPGAGMGATPALPPRGAPQTAPMANNYPQGANNYPPPATNYPPSGNNYPSGAGNYPPPVISASPGGGGGGRRGDVFDPSQNPNAPGAPQALGSPRSASQPPTGAGRQAGAPLDLSTPGGDPSMQDDQGMPPRYPNAGGGSQVASVAPPSATPRDEFDLASGYVQRKDYALAEDSLRSFLKKYPSDPRVADAQYLLGESLYQRQRYRDAAESFLTVTTKFERNAKAPDSLMRLGQSLAALGEKETACAAWGEIGRKYANASAAVKRNVAAEQKRVRC